MSTNTLRPVRGRHAIRIAIHRPRQQDKRLALDGCEGEATFVGPRSHERDLRIEVATVESVCANNCVWRRQAKIGKPPMAVKQKDVGFHTRLAARQNPEPQVAPAGTRCCWPGRIKNFPARPNSLPVRSDLYPVPLRREFDGKLLISDVFSRTLRAKKAQNPQTSLLFSLIPGISGGDGFAGDCVGYHSLRR